MREILFRGMREDNGEWIYGDLLQDRDLGEMMIEHFDYYIDENGRQRDYCQYEVIPKTVGQYTGLTDSEGNKIFEGDVIKYADKWSYNCYIEQLENKELQSDYIDGAFDNLFHYGEVKYGLEHGYPAFDLSYHHFESNGLQELSKSGDWHYVVVGNIHDREL